MIVVLCLVFGFTALGFPIRGLLNPSLNAVFAPALGLGAIILFSYVISTSTGLSGAESTALSVAFWTFFALIWYTNEVVKRGVPAVQGENVLVWVFCCVPGILLLIPAGFYGLDKFFGAVNFDFFYNSRDAVYLSNHSVNSFTGKTEELLPFIWSSDQQGRFGVNLFTAALVKFLDFNAVRINAELISALVIINSLAFFGFVQKMYKANVVGSVFLTLIVIFSAGFAQGYSYYLLGQISALPLFTVALVLCIDIVRASCANVSADRTVISIVVVLNALYILYAILAVFAAVIAGVALIFSLVQRQNVPTVIRSASVLVGGTLCLFFLMRIFSLGALVESVSSWISLSLKTASADTSKPAIFSEYVLEPVLLLVFGVANYPVGESIVSGIVGVGPARGLSLLVLSLLTLMTFVVSIAAYMRNARFSWPEKSLVLSLSFVVLVGSFGFFFTGSGYSLFKIGDWLVPYLIPLFLFPAFAAIKRPNLPRIVIGALGALVVVGNLSSAVAYTAPFWLVAEERGVNATGINGMRGVEDLKLAVSPFPDYDLFFDLKNGIRNAWIANEFPSSHKLYSLSQNFQPLTDRVLPSSPCNSKPALHDGGILILDTGTQDVITGGVEFSPFFKTETYSATLTSKIDRYLFVGRGAYLVERGDGRDVEVGGFPRIFRWIEHGVELYYFTRKSGRIDLSFQAVPGYVEGPPVRNLNVAFSGGSAKATFSRENSRVNIKSLPVGAGLNCFVVSSADTVTNPARYGALLRPGTQIDFRLLNFALADVSATPSN